MKSSVNFFLSGNSWVFIPTENFRGNDVSSWGMHKAYLLNEDMYA